MDNLTHSFAGLVVGEIIERSLPAEPDRERRRRRKLTVLASSVLANNLPDLDIVFSSLLPEPLGYLLHHRGHTHTLLYVVPQALLLFGLLFVVWPSFRQAVRTDRWTCLGITTSMALGFLLHLMLDSLNSYGIHPFHPIDSRWFYGDLVFIVEPFFWLTLGLTFAFAQNARWLRWLGGTICVVVPFLLAHFGFFAWESVGVHLLVLATIVMIALRRPGGRTVLLFGVAAAIGFVLVQSYFLASARSQLRRELSLGEERILDVAMTGFPSMPLCWRFAIVKVAANGSVYTLSRGTVSAVQKIWPVDKCPRSLRSRTEASTPAIGVKLETNRTYQMELLRKHFSTNCYFRAWMRFARVPSIEPDSASDLRFSVQEAAPNFTKVDLSALSGDHCEGYVPPWGMPRQDLLDHK